jgi:hypothetical protein
VDTGFELVYTSLSYTLHNAHTVPARLLKKQPCIFTMLQIYCAATARLTRETVKEITALERHRHGCALRNSPPQTLDTGRTLW